MKLRVVLIVGLSLLDAVMTLVHIDQGLADEGNPAMALVLAMAGPAAFILVKMSMTSLAAAALYVWREHAAARVAASAALVMYVALTVYHVRIASTW